MEASTGPYVLRPVLAFSSFVLMVVLEVRFISSSVADPDSCFTDPDPGIFFQPRQKTHFSKGNNKIMGEIIVFNKKSRYFIKQGTFIWY